MAAALRLFTILETTKGQEDARVQHLTAVLVVKQLWDVSMAKTVVCERQIARRRGAARQVLTASTGGLCFWRCSSRQSPPAAKVQFSHFYLFSRPAGHLSTPAAR